MSWELIILSFASVSCALWLMLKSAALKRLETLSEFSYAGIEAPVKGDSSGIQLNCLADRLGKAGYCSVGERKRAKQGACGLIAASVLIGGVIGGQTSAAGAVLGVVAAGYSSILAGLYYLRWKAADYERELLFQLPIALESLVLLVESGLGILPAIERMVRVDFHQQQGSPVIRLLGVVYNIAASGVPLSSALELVAKSSPHRALQHVLLHLDVSSAEGGRLVPAIRSLSDHAHQEWKLGVETRVRRLESLVVFPVFIAVMGLLLVTAAVPLVPLIEFAESISKKQPALAALEQRSTPENTDERGG